MNNTNGALSFEANFENGNFNKAVDESNKKMQGLSNTAVNEGRKMDDAFKITTENLKIQKDVIAKLDSQLKTLNSDIDKMAPGMAQNDMRKQAAALTSELNGEKAALTMLEAEVKKTEVAHTSLRTQIRNLRDEMGRMEEAGMEQSKEYETLAIKAGKLYDTYGDIQKRISVLADDEGMFKGIMSGLTGLAGGFSAAQGAVGLFAGENENLNRIMLRVQSLMAITIGLQQLGETLNKESYFRIKVLSGAKDMLAAAELRLATAFGISNVAAKALMATLTFGITAAISGAIVVITKYVSKQKELKKEMQEINKATAEAAYKPLAEFERLRIGWENLGKSMKDKKKFITENADALKSLGIESKNVNDMDDIFIKNAQKFVDAIKLRAQAAALSEVAAQKYKESVLKMLEADKLPDKVTKIKTTGTLSNSGVGMMTTSETVVDNEKKLKMKAEADKLWAEANKLIDDSVKKSQQAIDVLSGMNIKEIETLKAGSIAAIEELIKAKQEALKQATNPADYAKIEAQINKLQSRIDVISGKDPEFDAFKTKISEQKTLFQKYEDAKKVYGEKKAKEMYAVIANSYKDYLINLRSEFQKNLKYETAVNEELIPIFNEEQLTKIPQIKAFYEKQIDYNRILLKQMKEQQAASKETKKQDKDTTIQNRLAYLDGLTNILDQIDSSLAQWTNNVANVVDSLGAINSDTATSSQKIGASLSLFSVLVSTADKFFSGINKDDDVYGRMMSATERFNTLLSAQVDLINSLVGKDKMGAALNALKEVEEAAAALLKNTESYVFDANTTFGEMIGKDFYDPEFIYETTKIVENLKSSRDSFKELAPNRIDYFDSAVARFEQLIKLKEQYDNIQLDFYSDMIGTSFDGISDGIRDGFENGYVSVKDFADFTKGTIRKALMEGFQTQFLDAQIKDWYMKFGEMASDGLTKEEAVDRKAALEAIISGSAEAFKEYQKMMEEIGVWQSDSTSKNTALSGALRSMTEDTGSLLAGYANAIRINQVEAHETMRNQLAILSGIERNTAVSNTHLAKLDRVIDLLSGDGARAVGLV